MFSTPLYKKIKFKFRQIIVARLIKIGLFFNWPELAAIALWLASDKINPKCKSQYTVLCMGRSVFADDIKAMAHYSGQIKYVTIWRTYFQNIFYQFIKGPEEKKLEEVNYHTHDFCKQKKQNYYIFIKKLFPLLQKLVGFDAVLSCSISYTDQQEIERVCAEQEIPYIILQKEAITAPAAYKNFLNVYKTQKFIGSKILFYNKQCQEGFLSLNIPGVTQEKTKLVGIPRFDYFFSKKQNNTQNSKQIVLFSFVPRVTLRFLNIDEGVMQKIENRNAVFITWIMDFALQQEDFKIIIKTKFDDQFLQYPKDILKNNFKKNIKNFVITNCDDPSLLIQNSMSVIGFNSTTLVEAPVAGKLIISPYFGDLIFDKSWSFFEEHPQLVNYVKTARDLEEYIFNADKYLSYDQETKNDFLKKYISTSNGGASIRAEEAIIEIIKR